MGALACSAPPSAPAASPLSAPTPVVAPSAPAASSAGPFASVPRDLVEAAAARPATAHGGPGVTVRVLVSDAAAYVSAAEPPAGFVACAEQQLAGVPLSTACMRRDGGNWVYAIARPGETAWARSGQLADCASCHALVARGLYGAPAR